MDNIYAIILNHLDSSKVKTRQIEWIYEMDPITWTEMNCFCLVDWLFCRARHFMLSCELLLNCYELYSTRERDSLTNYTDYSWFAVCVCDSRVYERNTVSPMMLINSRLQYFSLPIKSESTQNKHEHLDITQCHYIKFNSLIHYAINLIRIHVYNSSLLSSVVQV